MQTCIRRAIARASLPCFAWLSIGCSNWPPNPGQSDASVPVTEPDAGSGCVTILPFEPSSSGQVNGALCYGLAVDASAALACAPAATANVIECVDQLLGLAYVVVWSGSTGTVRAALDASVVGSVVQLGGSSFEVTTAAPLQASCTIELGPPARAQFCIDQLKK